MSRNIGKETLRIFGYPEQLPDETGAQYALFKAFLEQGSLVKLKEYVASPECPAVIPEEDRIYHRIRELNVINKWQERRQAYHTKVVTETALLQAETMNPDIFGYGLERRRNAKMLMEHASKLSAIIGSRLEDIYAANVDKRDASSPDYLSATDVLRLLKEAGQALTESAKQFAEAIGVQELQEAVSEAIKVTKKTVNQNPGTE
jgi:hypothetical protein